MIIIHENLPMEAGATKDVLKEVYHIDSYLQDMNLDKVFKPLPRVEGYIPLMFELDNKFPYLKGKAVHIITQRDLFDGDATCKDNDWFFGCESNRRSVVSVVRLRGEDNKICNDITVLQERYLRRLKALSVHEVGHGFVQGDHLKDSFWVNTKIEKRQKLGKHCTDNRCVMYEIVDVKTPSRNEGYLLIGDETRYDAGLDDWLDRMYQGWFCESCKKVIKIGKAYLSCQLENDKTEAEDEDTGLIDQLKKHSKENS